MIKNMYLKNLVILAEIQFIRMNVTFFINIYFSVETHEISFLSSLLKSDLTSENIGRIRAHINSGGEYSQHFIERLIDRLSGRQNCVESAKLALIVIDRCPGVREKLRTFAALNKTILRRKLQKCFS